MTSTEREATPAPASSARIAWFAELGSQVDRDAAAPDVGLPPPQRVTASGGTSSAVGGSPISGDGRLKNHTGNSSSVRYGLVVMAVHRGSDASQSARASQLLAAPAPSLAYGRDGSTRVHQPSRTRAAESNAFHPSSIKIMTRARRVRGTMRAVRGSRANSTRFAEWSRPRSSARTCRTRPVT